MAAGITQHRQAQRAGVPGTRGAATPGRRPASRGLSAGARRGHALGLGLIALGLVPPAAAQDWNGVVRYVGDLRSSDPALAFRGPRQPASRVAAIRR